LRAPALSNKKKERAAGNRALLSNAMNILTRQKEKEKRRDVKKDKKKTGCLLMVPNK
jgi:hypothetical protein